MRWKWITIGTVVLVSAFALAGYVALKTYDFDKLRPAITKTVKEATGRTLALGRMNLRIGLIPVLIVEEMSLDNPAWTSRRDLFRVRRMEVELALLPLFRKDVQVKRLILIEPDLQIETDHSGASNLVLPVVAKEGKSSAWERVGLPSMSFEKVVVERARVSFKHHGSSTPLLVRVHNLEAMAESFQSPVTMNFRGSSRGVPFTVQAVTGSLEELARRDKPWPLSATIQALGAQLKMKGSVQDVIRCAGFAVAFEGKGKSTKEVSKLMGLRGLPDIGPFRVAGTASDRAAKVYRFSDLTMRSRGGEVSGTLEIDLAGKRPSLRGSFSSQKLNLMPLLPPKEAKTKKRKGEKVFSEKTFQPALPTKIDADLKVQGKQLITPYGSLQDFLIDSSLREGSISLKAMRGAIDGGLIEGEVECRSGMNLLLLAGSFKVQKLELKSILTDMGARKDVEGSLDGEMEFSTSGDSVAALMARLNGKSIVRIGKGRIRNHCLEPLDRELGLPVAAFLGSNGNREDFTEVQCAVSGFQIREGLAVVSALVVDTPNTTICGTGDVDLKTEGLNLYLEPMPKKGVAGLTLSLNELAKPLMLCGTLSDPSVSLDPSKTAVILGKAVGGFVLLGPLGLVGALAGKTSEPNPCAAALKAAKKGVKESDLRRRDEKSGRSETGGRSPQGLYSGP